MKEQNCGVVNTREIKYMGPERQPTVDYHKLRNKVWRNVHALQDTLIKISELTGVDQKCFLRELEDLALLLTDHISSYKFSDQRGAISGTERGSPMKRST